MSEFKARPYQQSILDQTQTYVEDGYNPMIELDCGMGKRYLQLAMIDDIFIDKKILLILQASSSLYETFEYLKKHAKKKKIAIIDSRLPSRVRSIVMSENQVVLCLPQTLENTLKSYPVAIDDFEVIIINEVDQIIRRMGMGSVLKNPYSSLLSRFKEQSIVGMSGTLRDDHYVLDRDQIRIQAELKSLTDNIENSKLISMDSLDRNDVGEYISKSIIIPTAVDDAAISLVSMELELHIAEIKSQVMASILDEDPVLYYAVKKDMTKLFGPLPIDADLINKFHSAYLVRKYLWAMSPQKAAMHLISFGMDKKYVWNAMPKISAKHSAVVNLAKTRMKTVVLCSYLDTVNFLETTINKIGIKTVKISGQVPQHKRTECLNNFRESNERMVAILSSVGERDLDIPEADLLIIFDLINTTKTVYQKMKRSRGGDCRILYFNDTKEADKVNRVITGIMNKYPWSVKKNDNELLTFQ